MRSYDMKSDRMQANRARIPLYITMSADPRTKAEKVIKKMYVMYIIYINAFQLTKPRCLVAYHLHY